MFNAQDYDFSLIKRLCNFYCRKLAAPIQEVATMKPKINKIDAPPRAPTADEKLKERQKRFGAAAAGDTKTVSGDAKLQSRAER